MQICCMELVENEYKDIENVLQLFINTVTIPSDGKHQANIHLLFPYFLMTRISGC